MPDICSVSQDPKARSVVGAAPLGAAISSSIPRSIEQQGKGVGAPAQ